MRKKIIDLIYPARCPLCGDIVMPRGQLACPECMTAAPYVTEPMCKKCGKPLQDEIEEYCSDCRTKEHSYDKGLALFAYDDMVKQSISRFKYENKREYAGFYGHEMVLRLGTEIRSWKADAIIPIPLHRSRQRYRGYNQSELIAEVVGRELQIPLYTHLVMREKKTIAQKKLNHGERQNNLKRAFKISQNDVKLDTVILLDDIYTTGSTIDAVAAILKNTGVKQVFFIALSVGHG